MINLKDKIAIVIASYDGYSDIWNSFFENFYNWFPHEYFEVYLINNVIDYKFRDVKIINTGVEKSWSGKIRTGLENIPQENVLFFLEDYLIGEIVNEEKLMEAINYYLENKLHYLRLVNTPKLRSKDNYLKVNNGRYAVNLQLAIWDKKALLDIVSKGEFSAWEFEKKMNDGEISVNRDNYYSSNKDIITIKNGIIKGKWYPSTVKYFLKKGINIKKDSTRIEMSFFESTRYAIKGYLLKITPNFLVSIIKPLLKKIGFKFTT